MKKLSKIAESNNLELVELTEGRNGYPQNISKAIDASSLENFKQVEEIAEKHELGIILIHQKDGWHFWEDKGRIFDGIKVTSSEFGDNYSEIYKQEEEDFIKSEVAPLLEDAESFEQIQAVLDTKKEIWEQVELMEDDEVIITHEGRYYDKFKQTTLSFSEDTHNWKVALIKI